MSRVALAMVTLPESLQLSSNLSLSNCVPNGVSLSDW